MEHATIVNIEEDPHNKTVSGNPIEIKQDDGTIKIAVLSKQPSMMERIGKAIKSKSDGKPKRRVLEAHQDLPVIDEEASYLEEDEEYIEMSDDSRGSNGENNRVPLKEYDLDERDQALKEKYPLASKEIGTRHLQSVRVVRHGKQQSEVQDEAVDPHIHSSSRSYSSCLIDRSKSALGPIREKRIRDCIRYSKHKAHYYSEAMFKYAFYSSIINLIVDIPMAFTAAGGAWELISKGTEADAFVWISFVLATWIIFWSQIRKITNVNEKHERFSRDSSDFQKFASYWSYELSIGVDDREAKCEIETRKCADQLNDLEDRAYPIPMPPLPEDKHKCRKSKALNTTVNNTTQQV